MTATTQPTYTDREAAHHYRAHLRYSWQATTFRVGALPYNGGRPLCVTWQDGPSKPQVFELLDCIRQPRDTICMPEQPLVIPWALPWQEEGLSPHGRRVICVRTYSAELVGWAMNRYCNRFQTEPFPLLKLKHGMGWWYSPRFSASGVSLADNQADWGVADLLRCTNARMAQIWST